MAQAAPYKTLHLYDTFEGLPHDDIPGGHHRKGEFAASLDEVKVALKGCPNVLYHPGFFPDTAVDVRYCCVHIDADLYQSTADAIDFFWPRLVMGGMLIFDDFENGYCPGVKQAILERGLLYKQTTPMQCVVEKQPKML